jgi:integrase
MAEKIAKGIRRDHIGFQIYARIKGEFVSKRFPPDTKLEVLREQLKNLRSTAQLGLDTARPVGATTLAADVDAYLKAKAAMPSIRDRTQRMAWWCKQLGLKRSRDSITTLEVRQHLEGLLTAGRSKGTAKQYYIALHDFFKIMDDGDVAKNPVHRIERPKEIEQVWTLPTLDAASRAIAHAAARADGVPDQQDSVNRARLRVLLWTGWPNEILKLLRPSDIHWETRTATVHARLKGGGTRPRTVPLLPQAIDALEAFVERQAFGRFSNSSLRKALHRGCDRTGVVRFNPYKLRHLLGTTASKLSNDERGVSELMLHTDPRQTWRYTRHAASVRAQSTIDVMTAALPTFPPRPRLVKPG